MTTSPPTQQAVNVLKVVYKAIPDLDAPTDSKAYSKARERLQQLWPHLPRLIESLEQESEAAT